MSLNIAFDLSIPDDLDRFMGDQDTSDAIREKWALYGARISEFFHHPDCLRVTRGGYLAFQTTEASKVAQTDLNHLLDLVSYLIELQPCEGFERLVSKLQDSSKFQALCFEIGVGLMLLRAPTTVELKIEPEVTVNGRIKRPEYAWYVKGHDTAIYIECKRHETFELDIRRKAQTTFYKLSEQHQRLGNWPEGSRIDIGLPQGIFNHSEVQALELMKQVSDRLSDGDNADVSVKVKGCTATLRRQGDPTQWKEPMAVFYTLTVAGNTLKRWAREEADLLLGVNIERQTLAAVIRSVQTALKQLPLDATAIIAVSVGTIRTVAPTLQAMLDKPSWARIAAFVVYGKDGTLFIERNGFLRSIGMLKPGAVPVDLKAPS